MGSINENEYRGFKWTRGDEDVHALAILLPETNKALHLAGAADHQTDWNRAALTSDPRLIIHSDATPATDYVEIFHTGSNTTINSVSGTAMRFQFDGTTFLNLSSTGIQADFNLQDDVDLAFGTSSDATLTWSTADANANELVIQLPAGGGTNVPVIVIGSHGTAGAFSAADLGLFDGRVSTVVAIFGSTATATGPMVEFRKSRGTTTAPTVVTSGDDMGSLDFYASDGTVYNQSARILAEASGTIAAGRMPSVLTFQTSTDAGTSVLTTAMQITAAQHVVVSVGDSRVTAGNLRLGAVSAFAGTEPTSTVVVKVGTAPAGAITTSGGVFTDGTVMRKIIANGTASNIEAVIVGAALAGAGVIAAGVLAAASGAI